MTRKLNHGNKRDIADKLRLVEGWVSSYRGNRKAKNYLKILKILRRKDLLPEKKYAELMTQIEVSKHNAPNCMAHLFFQGRSRATQSAYTELGKTLRLQSNQKEGSAEEFGERVLMPWEMHRLLEEDGSTPR
jgi:hypothetical protein